MVPGFIATRGLFGGRRWSCGAYRRGAGGTDEGMYEGIHEGKREGMLEGSDALAVSSTVERADVRTARSNVSQYDISHSPNAASAAEHGQSVSRIRSEIIMTTREKIKESNVAMFVLGGAAAVGLHYLCAVHWDAAGGQVLCEAVPVVGGAKDAVEGLPVDAELGVV